MRSKSAWLLTALLVAAVATTGCATKKYVQGETSAVKKETGDRISEVEGQVEKAQSRLNEHEGKIQQNSQGVQQASKTAQEALERAQAAGKLAEGKLLYETVLTDEKVKFGFDKANLSDEAKAALDEFASKLKTDNKNVYIEIQGHTDSVGSEKYNYDLGLERAEAVRRYLNLTDAIPLHRMSVISYGESAPIADNKTREGRSQNRRVALVVLE